LLTLPLLFSLGSCGSDDSPEGLARQNTALLKDFGTTLSKITDASSAKQYTPTLEKLSERAKDLQARMSKAGEPDEEASKKLITELGPEMGASMQKITQEMIRIGSDPELQAILGPTLDKMDF
jgi:hypothetical protein